jgi:hypothetical protein
VKLILNIKREKGSAFEPSLPEAYSFVCSRISGVSKILLQDGLGYFVIVMVGHVLNLAFLKSPVSLVLTCQPCLAVNTAPSGTVEADGFFDVQRSSPIHSQSTHQ